MRDLWRVFDWKMQIFGPRSQFLAAFSHAAAISSKSASDYSLITAVCAFWTAGFTARPPGIGSASCYTIFQVSNRTIGCILDRSGGCCEDIVWICLSLAGWLGQRWDVQLFSHEIYTASRLFFAHSAGLLKSYICTCRVSDRHIFHEYFGRNGVNRGQNLEILGNPTQNNLIAKVLGAKTSETYIVKKSSFYLLTSFQFWVCFWTRLGVLRSPM